MCVAIYKPAGVKTPALETLSLCWNTNPHGAGFAMRNHRMDRSKCHFIIHKGYMEWSAFCKAYKDHDLGNYDGELFLHFRIATHGGINPGCTHPFPVYGADKNLLKVQHLYTDTVMIHNGVLPCTPRCEDISDTMELALRLSKYQLSELPSALAMLEGFTEPSKLAFLTSKGVTLMGNWTNIDGVQYSNTHWQSKTKKNCGHHHTSAYDYDDYDLQEKEWEREMRVFLSAGRCPYCGDALEKDTKHNVFYCAECQCEFDMQKELF